MTTPRGPYLPKPYLGVVTEIRPAKQYRIFNKPDLKWDSLSARTRGDRAAGNPASMLIEPFVEHLVSALRQSIDAAIQRCEARSSE
ncbi:MAG: hypothetical protein WBQ08_05605 [Candidatus Sulfotelmatobacter sp.]